MKHTNKNHEVRHQPQLLKKAPLITMQCQQTYINECLQPTSLIIGYVTRAIQYDLRTSPPSVTLYLSIRLKRDGQSEWHQRHLYGRDGTNTCRASGEVHRRRHLGPVDRRRPLGQPVVRPLLVVRLQLRAHLPLHATVVVVQPSQLEERRE